MCTSQYKILSRRFIEEHLQQNKVGTQEFIHGGNAEVLKQAYHNKLKILFRVKKRKEDCVVFVVFFCFFFLYNI